MANTGDFQQEVLARLKALQSDNHEKPPDKIPLIDPTANVLALVSAETKRQDDLKMAESKRVDDLRHLTEKFQDKISDILRKSDAEAKAAEAGRIDALLVANKNDVALALSKQQAQAEAQDKRIAILEQNQYTGVGRQGQATESRQRSEWITGLIIGGVIALIQIVIRFLK